MPLREHVDFGLRYQYTSGSTDRKVKVVRLNLFTDDTSGNITKKWNKFDTWSMVPAALPLEERNKRENTHLICAHNRLSAMDMLPEIVDDLKELEQGVPMFDAERGEIVVVVAPLNFISADNPRHAEIACNKGLAPSFPCRKCLYRKPRNSKVQNRDHRAAPRDAIHIAGLRDNVNTASGIQLSEGTTCRNLVDLGYKKTSGEALVELNAFDPTRDCLVEILHTMMLGVTKYLVSALCSYLNKEESRQLEIRLRTYKSKAFTRTMNSSLRLQKFFVGRDYKLLAQQLPGVLNSLLHQEWSTIALERRNVLLTLFSCFVAHGELVSLLFIGKITAGFWQYTQLLDEKIKELTTALNAVDDTLLANQKSNNRISSRPKVHMLHYLREDLERFATALHYKSEKGEQFNKFIREHIFHSNRQTPSRDLLVEFGRQFMFRDVIDGGSWETGTN